MIVSSEQVLLPLGQIMAFLERVPSPHVFEQDDQGDQVVMEKDGIVGHGELLHVLVCEQLLEELIHNMFPLT